MYSQLAVLINQSIQHFQNGNLLKAEELLYKALSIQQRNFDALHLLGVIKATQGKTSAAVDFFQKALSINKGNNFLHFNLAKALSESGKELESLPHHKKATQLAPRHQEAWLNYGRSQSNLKRYADAIRAFDKALDIDPTYSEAWSNKGLVLITLDQPEAALACYEKVIELKPDYAEANNNKGTVLATLGQPETALACYEKAIELKPDYAEAFCNKGIALTALGQPETALACYEKAIELKPDYAEAYNNNGAVLAELDQPEVALACYEKAIELKPDYAETYNNKGTLLADLNQLQAALTHYDKAIELNPDYFDAYNNKGAILADLGDVQSAQACFDMALKVRPNYADARWRQSLLQIKSGNYSTAWEGFESRWRVKALGIVPINTSKPLWQGEESDKNLLIWAEQGIGDQILFGSTLPDLSRFPQKKYVALDKRLIPLFQRSMKNLEFLDRSQVNDEIDFAEHLPIGSLPRHFRQSCDDFVSAQYPYLTADTNLAKLLRQKTKQAGKLTCGISWNSTRKKIGRHKSLSLDQLIPPITSSNLHFVNLQYGDTADERNSLQKKYGVEIQDVAQIDNYNDIDGLAALIEACDIVITTSNSTAHLAGALGKETLLLLPLSNGRLWYWASHEGGNPWYRSITLFAQEQAGDWRLPLSKIKSYLERKTWS